MSDKSTPPTQQSDPRPDLTVAEVATILRVVPQTVREMIRDGRLKAYTVGKSGQDFRVTQAALDEFRGLST